MGSTAEVTPLPEDEFVIGSHENVVDAINGIFVRHPMCQDELSEMLKHTQSASSRHLVILRSAGVIPAEHQRQNVYYRVANQNY